MYSRRYFWRFVIFFSVSSHNPLPPHLCSLTIIKRRESRSEHRLFLQSLEARRKSKSASTLLLTAFSSPKFPHLAKCALKLAFALPAATPHKALKMLDALNNSTLGLRGRTGDKQSRSIAASLKMSAASRYILHSGSRAVPSLCAKRIVAIRPADS